ncbi:hypothetical protein [Nereida sp. MMG025]|uniref:hypothetical protein n=1 Tax=Nereida sp. MMG025 TaxID=2909981 RepID=UPI001F1667D0|nr:hypothetical protein [Nereida sp. MMG025]MCF6444477.1 hypothetical protein [Nereida sp. MMG025]
MDEVVIASAHAGNGYSAAAQRAFGGLPSRDPRALLMGTINAKNIPSIRSAQNAGRKNVLNYVFIPLSPSDPD